ncbi:MAG: hypothetical protein ACLPN1_10540 [Dissulfurispiraceae bacterium]
MTDESKPNELETIEELIISSALEQEALVNLLLKKGIITPAEFVEELTKLRREQ